MKLHDLRAFIVLLAGLIALIINMKTGREVTVSLLIVLVVILIFYFIATLVVEILHNYINKFVGDNSESDDDENIEDDLDAENSDLNEYDEIGNTSDEDEEF